MPGPRTFRGGGGSVEARELVPGDHVVARVDRAQMVCGIELRSEVGTCPGIEEEPLGSGRLELRGIGDRAVLMQSDHQIRERALGLLEERGERLVVSRRLVGVRASNVDVLAARIVGRVRSAAERRYPQYVLEPLGSGQVVECVFE